MLKLTDQNVNNKVAESEDLMVQIKECNIINLNSVNKDCVYQRGGAGVASVCLWGCRVGRTQRSLGDRSRLNRSRWNGWGGAGVHRHLFMDQGLSFIEFLLLRCCACTEKHTRKMEQISNSIRCVFSAHVHTVTSIIRIHIHGLHLIHYKKTYNSQSWIGGYNSMWVTIEPELTPLSVSSSSGLPVASRICSVKSGFACSQCRSGDCLLRGWSSSTHSGFFVRVWLLGRENVTTNKITVHFYNTALSQTQERLVHLDFKTCEWAKTKKNKTISLPLLGLGTE